MERLEKSWRGVIPLINSIFKLLFSFQKKAYSVFKVKSYELPLESSFWITALWNLLDLP